MPRFAALALTLALPLAAQLPPGISRVSYQDEMTDAYFFAATPDGTLWAASILGDDFARIDPTGAAGNFELPHDWRGTRGMTAGPDGALWIGGIGWVARIDPATNELQRWPIGSAVTAEHMLSGPDGNLWFLQGSSVARMRTDGKFLSLYGAERATGAAFGTDGALYLAATNRLVRVTAAGERTTFPAAVRHALYAGPGFLWSGTGRAYSGPQPAETEIVKLSYRGETLATYRIAMTPFASDALGNLWLRARTAEGEVVGQLSPYGVLTRFGPLPALPSTDCYPNYYGGLAFLADGRVAMSDFYPEIAFTLLDPCRSVPRPETLRNTVTILDPRVAPVQSVEPLNPLPRRRLVRR